mmetsp:Transcript_21478/g.47653  ORF Transcript_21478/g.47653 Transcript_21478/m.47653 type:complete len:656 (+) Transcript_21478:40-2007(+)
MEEGLNPAAEAAAALQPEADAEKPEGVPATLPETVPVASSVEVTSATTSTSKAEGDSEAPAESAEVLRERRCKEALARGEAPIRPEFLVAVTGQGQVKRVAEDTRRGQDEEAGGHSKRRRGQNKAKDRAGNMNAMRKVRETQLCSRLAFLNTCSGEAGCKNSHDVEAFLAAKPSAIAEECPVLRSLGVCPAGLNCRFSGHVVDGKNVDREGKQLSEDSPWLKETTGIGQPLNESNAFSFDLISQLRKKTMNFDRSSELAKEWQRYVSGTCEQPIGAIVQAERKPVDFNGKLVLAPLTTVGNLPFRRLCVKLGCEVTVGEMALARTILDGGPAELALLRRHKSERCFGIQVAGGDVEEMTKVAQFVDEHVDCDFVDINCGCPLDEVHKRGAGSRLMSRPKVMEGIVRCMSSVLRTKPLTLKMRTAHFQDKKETEFDGRIAHKLTPLLEEWGVSAITLHGRTARQRYTKLADWGYINECSARRVRRIPLIGGGDVLTWEEVETHRRDHGVDSIMVARGALMKPWLFTEVAEKRHWDISASERLDLYRDFTNFGLEHWGADARGVETTRRFLLEWLSFACRYVPIGLLEVMPPMINWRPRQYVGRNDLETKLASQSAKDWIDITEMLLGPVPDGFSFMPKHKSASYEQNAGEAHDVAG